MPIDEKIIIHPNLTAIEILTPKQVKDCQEAFDMFKNDNNEITTGELISALRALGYNSNQVILEKINEMDIESNDGVGKINFEEFLNLYLTQIRYAFTRNDILSDLKLIDANNDGQITESELRNYLGKLKILFSSDEIDEIVNNEEINNNGSIDYEKFIMMMCQNDVIEWHTSSINNTN